MLPVKQGKPPRNGDGQFKIKLTQTSAEVLPRVAGMKRWRVQPTMTRGARMAPKPPAPNKKKGQKNPVTVNLDIRPKNIARTKAGGEAIQTLLLETHRLDIARWPGSAMFGKDGKCQMYFDGADQLSFEDISASAPEAFDVMHLLSKTASFLLTPASDFVAKCMVV